MLVAGQRQVCQLPSLPSQLRLPTTRQPRAAAAATVTQVHHLTSSDPTMCSGGKEAHRPAIALYNYEGYTPHLCR